MKTYLFSLAEWVSYVEQELLPYLGVATHYCNHQALIASVLNDLLCELYGFPPGAGYCFVTQVDSHREETHSYADFTSEDILIDYNIPSDIRATILQRLRQGLLRLITNGMGALDPSAKEYRVVLDAYGDVEIREQAHVAPAASTEEQLRREIVQGLENGDWYPEHMRRLAGY